MFQFQLHMGENKLYGILFFIYRSHSVRLWWENIITKTSEQLSATEAITTVALYKPAEYGKNTHSFLNETSTGQIAKRENSLQYNFGPVIKVEDSGTSLMILKIPREEDLTPVDALARNETLPIFSEHKTFVLHLYNVTYYVRLIDKKIQVVCDWRIIISKSAHVYTFDTIH